MPNENSKIHEIKRLTTPITFKNSKAYDSDGQRVKCVESLSEIKSFTFSYSIFLLFKSSNILLFSSTELEINSFWPQFISISSLKFS